jgi:hypothetical protein
MTGEFIDPRSFEGDHSEGFLTRLKETVDNLVHVRRHAHQLMIDKASGVEHVSNGFFTAIPLDRIEKESPDSVSDFPYLEPNAVDQAEIDMALGLLDAFLGESKIKLAREFVDFADRTQLFERIKDGQTIIVPSNHSVFQDQGYHLGLMHLAARELGQTDRFELHATTVLGKTLGYLEVAGLNVIDDILRKAGGVLKTFPVSGSETLREAVFTDEDMDLGLKSYQKICNAQVRRDFQQKVESKRGEVIFLAGGATPDTRNENGDVFMSTFDNSTCKLMFDAVKAGALIAPLFGDYDGETHYARFADRLYGLDDFESLEDIHQIGRIIAAQGQFERALNQHEERFNGNIYYPA